MAMTRSGIVTSRGGDHAGQMIEFYTRPRCPYSFRLRRRLRRHGIEFREINIWKDPDARDRVRAVANGNETVPTVCIGDQWLVNPSIEDVVALIGRSSADDGGARDR